MEVQFWTGGDLGKNGIYNCNEWKVSDWKRTLLGHNRLPQYWVIRIGAVITT